MPLRMITDQQFRALKLKTDGKKTRQSVTADLVSASGIPDGRLTSISLWVSRGEEISDVTEMLSLSTRHLWLSQVERLVGQPVEVVYDEIERKGSNPPSIYGQVVAVKCSHTILHDIFPYQ